MRRRDSRKTSKQTHACGTARLWKSLKGELKQGAAARTSWGKQALRPKGEQGQVPSVDALSTPCRVAALMFQQSPLRA